MKGKYPTQEKGDKAVYGYVGNLELHPEMVLAIPFFSNGAEQVPAFTAYMPSKSIKQHARGYRCQPARFRNGEPQIRGDHRKFFDERGVQNLELPDFRDLEILAVRAGAK